MIFLGFLLASIAAVDSQPLDVRGMPEWNNGHSSHSPNTPKPLDVRGMPEWNNGHSSHSPNTPKSNTVIENKNVNIIVNVDPKEVAKELYKLIQGHLGEGQGRRSDNTKQTINEIEKIITPVVTPTRRSNRPTAFEVAYSLDHLTRKALSRENLTRPTIDDEIVTRYVVASMLTKLKEITETNETNDNKSDKKTKPTLRRMLDSTEVQSDEDDSSKDDDDDDRYLTISIKMLKSDILKRATITKDH